MGFQERVLPSCWFERRLRAVLDLVFQVGADLIPNGQRFRVRFAAPTEEHAEFLHHLRTLSEGLPIVAQLEWDLAEEACQPSYGMADPTLLGTSNSHHLLKAPLPDRLSTVESWMISEELNPLIYDSPIGSRHRLMEDLYQPARSILFWSTDQETLNILESTAEP